MKHRQGFTLVEMVLYVAACSIFLLALSSFMSYLLQARVRSQVIGEVNQQASQVMYLMTETIRNGRVIVNPDIGTASTTISITTGVQLLDPTKFYVASNTLYVKEGSRSDVPLTNSRINVSNLLFTNMSSTGSVDRTIRINFTIDYKNLSGRNEYTFSKTFTGSATLRQ